MDAPRRQQWEKELRRKRVTASWKLEDIWQDLWENHWAGDREENSCIFHQDSKSEQLDIVEESASSKMKEETAHRGAITVGPLTTLGTFAPTDWKSSMMMINLDWHVITEPIGSSSLKEGAAGAVGE
jgi:hypothetical protein